MVGVELAYFRILDAFCQTTPIAQYLAGLRPLGTDTTTVNAVNAASPRQDDANGDKLTITDALFIAQMLAGIRDSNYIQK